MSKISLSILLLPFILFASNLSTAQSITERPQPHFGAHIEPQFTNLWNMINSEYGSNYGSANMGNSAGGHAIVYLDKDGWTRAGKDHTFMVNLVNAENPNLKVKVGDLFHCQYKGTWSQFTLQSSDVTTENTVESGGYVTFDIKIKTLGSIYFKIVGKITDVQIMRPGYILNDPRLVTDECKDYLKGLQVVRLMGQSGCNRNYEREWKYRTPANAPFQNLVNNGDNNEIRGNLDNCFDERGNNSWLPNSFNQDRSYPWEKAIELCNYLNVDFYANVPVLADLNYMRELAKLLKAKLKPTLNIYIEIGNELWNFGGGGAFHGFAMEFASVHNMVIVQGDKTIEGGINGIVLSAGDYGNGTYWTGGMGNYTAARRWPAYRLKQFMDEFAKEFGFADKGGVGVRIRAVLAGQLHYGWGQDYWFIGNEGVYFLEKQFGAGTANKYLYGLAIASYVQLRDDETKSIDQITNMSVSEIIKALNTDLARQFGEFGEEGDCRTKIGGNCEGNELEDILALSKKFGLKVIAYEGGPEANIIGNGSSVPMKNIVAAYNSPEMYQHTLDYMNKWYSWLGYDALFIKNGFFTQKGYGAGYAVAEKEGDISQQYKAYRDIMDKPTPALTMDRGEVLGVKQFTTLPGNKIAAYRPSNLKSNSFRVSTFMDENRTLSWNNALYLIRNETPGKYKLTVEYNNGGGVGKKFEILLDGKLISTIEVAYTFGEVNKFSQPISLDIPYGAHALEIKVPANATTDYAFEVHNLKFEMVDFITSNESAAYNSSQLSLIPNPAKNQVLVSFSNSQSQDFEQVEVLDLMGQSIAIYQVGQEQTACLIDISSISKGMYMVRAKGKKGVVCNKLMVE